MSSKEAALNVWRAFASRDPVRIRDAFTPDARWIAPPDNATAIASGAKAEDIRTVDGMIAFITGPYVRLFPEGAKVEFTKIVADGDTVVFEQTFSARVCNGRMYENHYCWVFEVRDGRVTEMREYMDTHGGYKSMFGDEAPRKLI
jgi:uncharacterized protein